MKGVLCSEWVLEEEKERGQREEKELLACLLAAHFACLTYTKVSCKEADWSTSSTSRSNARERRRLGEKERERESSKIESEEGEKRRKNKRKNETRREEKERRERKRKGKVSTGAKCVSLSQLEVDRISGYNGNSLHSYTSVDVQLVVQFCYTHTLHT